MKRVVVIGGGLSGLSAARAVAEEAEKLSLTVEITLLERDPVVGGKIRSTRDEGFLCEAGPNGFLDNKPSTMALVGRMGINDRLLKSNDEARKRFIFCDGRLQQLPEDPVNFILSELMSIRGKLRMGMEMLLPVGDPTKDETVAEFVRRRLGEEALDKLIDPMSAGIYAGDPAVMSIKSCFPKVVAIEQQFGGLLKGMLAMQKMAKARGQEGPQSAGPGGVLWSFVDGAWELCERLGAELFEKWNGSVRTCANAETLTRSGVGWTVVTSEGERLEADSVVFATPAYDAAKLLAPHAAQASEIMSNIPYVPMAVVCLGFERAEIAHPLDGFGFLIPGKEGRRILGALWSSSIFLHRAPDGKVLFTLMVGGARSPHLSALHDEALLAACKEELAGTLGVEAQPVFTSIERWKRAIPQYVVGHNDRVAKIEAELGALGGVFLGGNAYYGIGINDCTARAEVLGPAVCASLAK